ncbi:MAG: hypothetical protein HQK49_22515 [Oligoflexia bacterium]|nr:hypothetical protein [Oligoflexia bacterium]
MITQSRVHFIPSLNDTDPKILYIDFSNLKTISEFIRVIDMAKSIIRSSPQKSLLTLTNFTGGEADNETQKIIADYAKGNTPYIKAAAVIGITGVRRVLYYIVIRLSNRNIHLCDNKDEAIKWLSSQL